MTVDDLKDAQPDSARAMQRAPSLAVRVGDRVSKYMDSFKNLVPCIASSTPT